MTPDRKTVLRRRAVLAGLVGLSLALLTLFFGEAAGGTLHGVQRGAQAVLGPIELGASRALKPVRDLVAWTGDTLRAKGENERLRAEAASLRAQVARMQTERRDELQLGALAQIARQPRFPEGFQPVTGRVIARSPQRWYSAVDIDKGSGDGIERDQPVITGDGLVGRVTSVTGATARVTLITDSDSAVSAQVGPAGAKGVVKPKVGRPDDLLLDYIEGGDVREGAIVVTSGSTASRLESLFPRGIPIGRVRRADPAELEGYQLVHLQPFADLRRFDFVQVLTSGAGEQRASTGQP
jgi:rod shape-determining protein MreC